jgi:mono/diheme cytochrome c family protein
MRHRAIGRALLPAALVVSAAACAADAPQLAPLSAEAEQGRQVSMDIGCATCHGADGLGGAAPGYGGMWGTEITLESGETVTYDDVFVTAAIRDPQAQIRTGVSSVEMPAYDEAALSDTDLAAILAFIEELGTVDG